MPGPVPGIHVAGAVCPPHPGPLPGGERESCGTDPASPAPLPLRGRGRAGRAARCVPLTPALSPRGEGELWRRPRLTFSPPACGRRRGRAGRASRCVPLTPALSPLGRGRAVAPSLTFSPPARGRGRGRAGRAARYVPLTPALSPLGRGRVAAPTPPRLLPSRLREGRGSVERASRYVHNPPHLPHPGPLPGGERESCGADPRLTCSPPACGRGRGRVERAAWCVPLTPALSPLGRGRVAAPIRSSPSPLPLAGGAGGGWSARRGPSTRRFAAARGEGMVKAGKGSPHPG